jgi:hypothetical protein
MLSVSVHSLCRHAHNKRGFVCEGLTGCCRDSAGCVCEVGDGMVWCGVWCLAVNLYWGLINAWKHRTIHTVHCHSWQCQNHRRTPEYWKGAVGGVLLVGAFVVWVRMPPSRRSMHGATLVSYLFYYPAQHSCILSLSVPWSLSVSLFGRCMIRCDTGCAAMSANTSCPVQEQLLLCNVSSLCCCCSSVPT